MSTGTLDPLGRLALVRSAPVERGRTGWGLGSMALAIVHSLGLLALFAVGSVPYLLKSALLAYLRPKRL